MNTTLSPDELNYYDQVWNEHSHTLPEHWTVEDEQAYRDACFEAVENFTDWFVNGEGRPLKDMRDTELAQTGTIQQFDNYVVIHSYLDHQKQIAGKLKEVAYQQNAAQQIDAGRDSVRPPRVIERGRRMRVMAALAVLAIGVGGATQLHPGGNGEHGPANAAPIEGLPTQKTTLASVTTELQTTAAKNLLVGKKDPAKAIAANQAAIKEAMATTTRDLLEQQPGGDVLSKPGGKQYISDVSKAVATMTEQVINDPTIPLEHKLDAQVQGFKTIMSFRFPDQIDNSVVGTTAIPDVDHNSIVEASKELAKKEYFDNAQAVGLTYMVAKMELMTTPKTATTTTPDTKQSDTPATGKTTAPSTETPKTDKKDDSDKSILPEITPTDPDQSKDDAKDESKDKKDDDSSDKDSDTGKKDKDSSDKKSDSKDSDKTDKSGKTDTSGKTEAKNAKPEVDANKLKEKFTEAIQTLMDNRTKLGEKTWPKTAGELADMYWNAAAAHPDRYVTPVMLAAQGYCESIGWQPEIGSYAGAIGIAQWLPQYFPAYARDMDGDGKVSPLKPIEAIDAQALRMTQLSQHVSEKWPNATPEEHYRLMFLGYNGGGGALDKYGMSAYSNPSLGYQETINYAKNIFTYMYTFNQFTDQAFVNSPTAETNKDTNDTKDTKDKDDTEKDQPKAETPSVDSKSDTKTDTKTGTDDNSDKKSDAEPTKPTVPTDAVIPQTSETANCPEGVTDLGMHTGYIKGVPTQMRLCAINGVSGWGDESRPGSSFYISGAEGKVIVNVEIAQNVMDMVAAAKADGITLSAVSSFRTNDHQISLWEQNGHNRAVVAPPGYSNHQGGVAIDWSLDGLPISANYYHFENGSRVAPQSKTWVWLHNNAGRFGFKQYSNEPWHWSPNAS